MKLNSKAFSVLKLAFLVVVLNQCVYRCQTVTSTISLANQSAVEAKQLVTPEFRSDFGKVGGNLRFNNNSNQPASNPNSKENIVANMMKRVESFKEPIGPIKSSAYAGVEHRAGSKLTIRQPKDSEGPVSNFNPIKSDNYSQRKNNLEFANENKKLEKPEMKVIYETPFIHREGKPLNEVKDRTYSEKPTYVRYLKKDSNITDPHIPKQYLPTEKVQELSPAAKVDYIVRNLLEDYPTINDPKFESAKLQSSVYENYPSKVIHAGKVDYLWAHPVVDQDQNLFQNVELHRYGHNLMDPQPVLRAPQPPSKNEYGHTVIHAPDDAKIEITKVMPTFAIKHPDSRR